MKPRRAAPAWTGVCAWDSCGHAHRTMTAARRCGRRVFGNTYVRVVKVVRVMRVEARA